MRKLKHFSKKRDFLKSKPSLLMVAALFIIPLVSANLSAKDDQALLYFFQEDWSTRYGMVPPGELIEIESKAPQRKLNEAASQRVPSMPSISMEDFVELMNQHQATKGNVEKYPTADSVGDYTIEFGIGNSETGKRYIYRVNRADLFDASYAVARSKNQTNVNNENYFDDYYPLEQGGQYLNLPKTFIEREDEVEKAWSNSTDNRIRRGLADGWNANFFGYIGEYDGCTAYILQSSSTHIWVQTAAHCMFDTDGNIRPTQNFRPRRDRSTGTLQNPYGTWRQSGVYGFYNGYFNHECYDDFNNKPQCLPFDIVIARFIPFSGTSTPPAIGRGLATTNTLNGLSKYRRGYPSCNGPGAPNPCTTDTLYGDGLLSVGEGSHLDGDNWHQILWHSSDMNPGDSGSPLYYYNNGNKYAFGVNIAERSNCYGTCPHARPNILRRITPSWANLLNAVMQ